MRIAEQNSKDQRGAALIEAALVIVLIAIIAIPSAKYIGESLEKRFQIADEAVSGAATGHGENGNQASGNFGD